MLIYKIINGIFVVALSFSLLACGGGGNESGPADSIQLSIAEVEVGAPGVCATGVGPIVHIFGGRPPYKLSNSVPLGMQLDKSSVAESGEGFTITFINGVCMKKMPITIEDNMGRIAQVVVSNGV